ncbi:MAG: hypothetical protein GXO87_02155 [Chlorobi bacterium]|nr:hypothetical protein [Chlorobiota bacterium]
MELLPIIYISVALFSIVIVVILIVSYFSYRIKKTSGNLEEDEQKLELKPLTKTKRSRKPVKKKSRKKTEKIKPSPKKTSQPVFKLSNKKSRLSILNDTLTNTKEENRLTNASKSSDILKSYSDEEDDNLFTMKVRKNRKKD